MHAESECAAIGQLHRTCRPGLVLFVTRVKSLVLGRNVKQL